METRKIKEVYARVYITTQLITAAKLRTKQIITTKRFRIQYFIVTTSAKLLGINLRLAKKKNKKDSRSQKLKQT